MRSETNSETPEWFEVALMMQDMSRKLPDDWDHGPDYWLGGVQQLAELVVASRGRLPMEVVAAAIGAGGLMIAHAVRQAEATDLTDALLARVRGKGGAA
jgi:ABC-type Fe3+ transport system substrate-binding protein